MSQFVSLSAAIYVPWMVIMLNIKDFGYLSESVCSARWQAFTCEMRVKACHQVYCRAVKHIPVVTVVDDHVSCAGVGQVLEPVGQRRGHSHQAEAVCGVDGKARQRPDDEGRAGGTSPALLPLRRLRRRPPDRRERIQEVLRDPRVGHVGRHGRLPGDRHEPGRGYQSQRVHRGGHQLCPRTGREQPQRHVLGSARISEHPP